MSLKNSTQSGFTMLEVLIAMVVLSIGLLGLASMQLNGLKSNNSAYQRTAASYLISDIADRMRANMTGVTNGSYNNLTATVGGSKGSCQDTATVCTATAMATSDGVSWGFYINEYLGAGSTASVTCDAVAVPAGCTNNVFTVTITWTDGSAQWQTGTQTTMTSNLRI